eukprot:746335-Hanusia_phi.AAC.7
MQTVVYLARCLSFQSVRNDNLQGQVAITTSSSSRLPPPLRPAGLPAPGERTQREPASPTNWALSLRGFKQVDDLTVVHVVVQAIASNHNDLHVVSGRAGKHRIEPTSPGARGTRILVARSTVSGPLTWSEEPGKAAT